jgi:hypothetical protein
VVIAMILAGHQFPLTGNNYKRHPVIQSAFVRRPGCLYYSIQRFGTLGGAIPLEGFNLAEPVRRIRRRQRGTRQFAESWQQINGRDHEGLFDLASRNLTRPAGDEPRYTNPAFQ